ncbi:MAG: Uma2 family endonuclease [Gemmataceae bacterium]
MSAGTLATKRATIADLAREPGKAELIDGRIVQDTATGIRPSRIAARIFRSLDDHATSSGHRYAFTDTLRYAVPELFSGRESFSPDASYYDGPLSENTMKFVEGPPTFAVEVRSENDYGPAAERQIATKRADYFEAGTAVVWDVDAMAREIRSYRATAPDQPVIFAAGSQADAVPTVPGWTVAVDWVMA